MAHTEKLVTVIVRARGEFDVEVMHRFSDAEQYRHALVTRLDVGGQR